MIKGSIQEDRKIINAYTPNIGAPKHTDTSGGIKGEASSDTLITGDLNQLISVDHPDAKSARKHRPQVTP